MRPAFVALTACLLAGCATVPADTAPIATAVGTPAFTRAPLPAGIPSDLPRTARPLHYRIAIAPDAANLAFSGSSSATIEIYEQADELVLHALELDISNATLTREGTAGGRPMRVAYDAAAQTAIFSDGAPIMPGTYRLDTRYTGTINTQAAGLFALDYPDKRSGESVRGLFTQFEAPDARRFAPLFDEPSYKATFDLSATVPAGQMAVSNMPAASEVANGDGTRTVTFQTTPLMSSYLLFFALGDFERATAMSADGTEVGIVAPAGSGDQAHYALDGLAPLLPYMGQFFGAPYPLPKLDNVAAPGQSQFFGAMENWGAILTFESILLNDPAITSEARRQQIFQTQAHEVAHQWFGDIVTMAWWEDLWLNEGFASWLETKTTDHFHPEWHALLSRVDGRENAMRLDSFASTHPVIQPINTVAETAQAFDAIAYQKGEAVLSMLEAYAGEEVWQAGLTRYIDRHQYANTTSADLWRAVEEAGATGLTQIADDFTRQPGVPLVSAADECIDGTTRLTLTQGEFSRDRGDDPAFAPLGWHVPLNIAVAGQAPVRHVLDGSATLDLPGCGAVVVNGGQLGYFRTLYEGDMVEAHTDAFASFAPIDQLGMLRDALSLGQAGYQPASYGYDLLAAVPADANPLVAGAAVGSWAAMHATVEDDEAKADIAARAAAAWGPRLAALGFDPVAGEAVVDSNLRAALIARLGGMGDEAVLAEASRRFAMLANDPRAMDGPLKTTWLSIVEDNATPAQWDMLLDLARNSGSAVERSAYYQALGATSDAALAQRALDLALTGEAGTASATIIARVSGHHEVLAFDFVMAHQDAVRELVDPSGWQGYVAGIGAGSTDQAMLDRLIAFRDTLPADEKVGVTRVIDRILATLATLPRQREEAMAWLAATAS